MENTLLDIIARGTPPQRYQSNIGQFIRAQDGRQIRLQGTDNKLTSAGQTYWRLRGIQAPSLYNYDQPLLNDAYVRAYDGTNIKVRSRTADGGWKITRKGEGYFRYNPSEFLGNVPYIMLKDGRIVRPVPAQANDWYMHLQDDNDEPILTTVSKVREARQQGQRLAATPAQQLAEVREAIQTMLRDPMKYPVIDTPDGPFTVLGLASEITYLWDESRPLVIDQRRTQFYDDQPPTTETILGRPLRRWALPDGMWRPFDLHPDTFEEFDHGCCVQMLHKLSLIHI